MIVYDLYQGNRGPRESFFFFFFFLLLLVHFIFLPSKKSLQMWSMKNKVAVVTGASGALGRAVAEHLLQRHGAQVGMVSHSQPPPEIPCSSRVSLSPQTVGFQCDITDPKACQDLFRNVRSAFNNKPVSLIVNCAGVTLSKVFLRCSTEDYDKILNLNLRGALNITQAGLRSGGLLQLQSCYSEEEKHEAGGSVVLVGSVVGTRGNEGQVLYSAAKSALSGAVKSLAKEYGQKQVRFNVVAPGLIFRTPMYESLSLGQREAFLKQSTLGRCGTADEVADTIIAVGMSSFLSGQTIEVSGGDK